MSRHTIPSALVQEKDFFLTHIYGNNVVKLEGEALEEAKSKLVTLENAPEILRNMPEVQKVISELKVSIEGINLEKFYQGIGEKVCMVYRAQQDDFNATQAAIKAAKEGAKK